MVAVEPGDSRRDCPRPRRLVARDLGDVAMTHTCPLWSVERRFVRDHVIRPGLTAASIGPIMTTAILRHT
ncbi:hypothetical protein JOF56_003867 [Kibdelosporangium banguiense]|uniref:Uncharacterized protein n=1 Tax=Kibdelosporangium banguiense TaxID=1365924 RepID=A0ABS4TGD4_9PSEU|nr:hypothetical protein [Kibdelosporangium banguiense]